MKGGGSMDKDSKRARIKAARDWLGQADDSLERADELQGDLKLMLAKAELEGASPGRRTLRLRKWLSRGAALAVAVLIVLAIENWPFGREPVQEDISPPVPVRSLESQPKEDKAAAGQAEEEIHGSGENPPPSGEPVEERVVAVPPQVQESAEAREGTFEAGTPQSAASPHLTYAPPRVPSADQQRLMQEAGEVLRR